MHGGWWALPTLRFTDEGLTEWHPAFLALGETLDACAKAYREFCKRYTPKRKKTTPQRNWGNRFLRDMQATKPTKGANATTQATDSGQMGLNLGVYQVDPLGSWFDSKAAQAFITANGAAAMT